MTSGRIALHLTLLIVLALAMAVPFAGKAFHIDDGIYIEIARKTGLNPFDCRGEYLYGGRAFDNLALNAHPIVVPYYIKGLMALVGGAKEIPLHLGFALFTILATVSGYFVARRFTAYPLLCTLLIIATPTFVLASHSLMTDLPQLAFWLTAVALGIHGIDRGSRVHLALCGVATALANFTGYQTLAILPLILLYGLLTGGRRGLWRGAGAMAIPAILFTGWSVGSYYTQGLVPILHAGRVGEFIPDTFPKAAAIVDRHTVKRMVSLLSNVGGVGLFPLIILITLCRRRSGQVSLIGGVAIGLVVLFVGPQQTAALNEVATYPAVAKAALFCFVAVGGALLCRIGLQIVSIGARLGRACEADRETLFLGLWGAGVAVYYCFVLPFGAARYLLPMLLPLSAMVLRAYGPVCAAGARRLWQIGLASVAGSVLLSIGLGVSDYQQAEVYRAFAQSRELDDWLEGSEGTNYAWAELGARFYLLERGMTYLSVKRFDQKTWRFEPLPLPKSGDRIVWCQNSWTPHLDKAIQNAYITPAESGGAFREYRAPAPSWPIRTYSRESNAGFYSHSWGFLPFWFDTSHSPERFSMLVVNPVESADK